LRIALLYGGPSAEREVSLSSGKAVEDALRALGHEVSAIDAGADLPEKLKEAAPDAVFNALHGRWGEDGCVQGICEWLKLPYTHSGVLASALAMDKPAAKRIFASAGLRCAKGGVFAAEQIMAGDVMPRPYVVKPLNEGSSVGVSIMREGDALPNDLQGEYLLEEYIAGREIQVAVLDGEALGAIEIVSSNAFYDYEAKYTDGVAQHLMPAPLTEVQTAQVLEMAAKAHAALGCCGLTRSDFMLSAAGEFFILEINTQPGMTPLSLAPEIAAHAGISFDELVERLVKGARLDG
jgi:D-alanine-D-alanine ligase